MMMCKLTWRNWRWLWHVYACCVSQDIIKKDRRFWCHFVPNLLEYTCAKNYQRRRWIYEVIAYIKWEVFYTHSVDPEEGRGDRSPLTVCLPFDWPADRPPPRLLLFVTCLYCLYYWWRKCCTSYTVHRVWTRKLQCFVIVPTT